MKLICAFIDWAARCWASFQLYFALAVQLLVPGAQAGWAGGAPNVQPSSKSATSSTGYGHRLSPETETSTPARATEEAAGILGRMRQNRQGLGTSPIKEPFISTGFPEELAEMLRQCCEAKGPVENFKVRQELAALYLLALAHSS